MKIILHEDVKNLGEEGDVKEVANGYARNYLLPRGLALPYSKETVAYFESIKDEIEARKAKKREAARSLKERLEELDMVIAMQAGPSGKLYGAVSSQTISDELLKLGFEVERKRIEVPSNSIKNIGNYEVKVKLYENALAVISLEVKAELPEEDYKDGAKKTKGKTKKTENSKAEVSEIETEEATDNEELAKNSKTEMEEAKTDDE